MAVIWITGARGFIGRHLAKHLAHNGAAVFGIGHGAWPEIETRDWGVQGWVNGAIEAANFDLLHSIGGTPEIIFHLAGGASVGASVAAPFEDFSRTVVATARLFDWLRLAAPQAQVLAVSSAAVYGAGHHGLISEDARLCPFSPYGHHKLMMEQICRAYADSFGIRSVIVRLFSVYGPWLRKQLLWDVCSRLADGAKVLQLGGTGRELRDWTEISDVVRLLEAAVALAGDEVPVVNGGSGTGTSVAEVARSVVAAWGTDATIEFTGKSRTGDPFSLVSTPCSMKGQPFSWRVPLSAGIPRYVEWFRKSIV